MVENTTPQKPLTGLEAQLQLCIDRHRHESRVSHQFVEEGIARILKYRETGKPIHLVKALQKFHIAQAHNPSIYTQEELMQ